MILRLEDAEESKTTQDKDLASRTLALVRYCLNRAVGENITTGLLDEDASRYSRAERMAVKHATVALDFVMEGNVDQDGMTEDEAVDMIAARVGKEFPSSGGPQASHDTDCTDVGESSSRPVIPELDFSRLNNSSAATPSSLPKNTEVKTVPTKPKRPTKAQERQPEVANNYDGTTEQLPTPNKNQPDVPAGCCVIA
jgi:hypothetical protein